MQELMEQDRDRGRDQQLHLPAVDIANKAQSGGPD